MAVWLIVIGWSCIGHQSLLYLILKHYKLVDKKRINGVEVGPEKFNA